MARRLQDADEVAGLKAMGAFVKKLRDDKGLSQRELARRAELTPAWLSHLEAGRAEPLWGTLRKLAVALDVPLRDLIASSEV